jgi:hypothetical protein
MTKIQTQKGPKVINEYENACFMLKGILLRQFYIKIPSMSSKPKPVWYIGYCYLGFICNLVLVICNFCDFR